MLEASVYARRGNFRLQVQAAFHSDWTVIFGPSGSGKSTLLRLLAGLDRPDAQDGAPSRILLNGEVLTDASSGIWKRPGARHTSLVSQQPALFPHLSVTANVAYGLNSLSGVDREARVREMLALVDGAQLASRRTPSLSGGEAQRVALARALAPQPHLLLLDEPFSALDATASDALLARLQEWLPAHGVQTILATHDAADAFATAAEVLLLREGLVEAQGPATTVLAAERERLARRLFAADASNH